MVRHQQLGHPAELAALILMAKGKMQMVYSQIQQCLPLDRHGGIHLHTQPPQHRIQLHLGTAEGFQYEFLAAVTQLLIEVVTQPSPHLRRKDTIDGGRRWRKGGILLLRRRVKNHIFGGKLLIGRQPHIQLVSHAT